MSAPVANACPRHPGVAAPYTCSRCQSPCCLNCCYTMPDSSICCSGCYGQAATPAASTPSVSSFQAAPTSTPERGCPQHPHLPPVSICKVCGRGSCVTCDFFFPPNLHLCPVCVTSAHTKLTPLRKKYLTMAIVMAVWSTIGMALLFGGVLAGLGEGFVLEVVVRALVVTPCSIGTGVAWAALKKGGPNPIGIWITLVWNSLLSVVMVLLMIIGLFMS
jgi:hypothetical protein